MKRCLIYALGGGLGHAVRSASLAQALASRGVEARVLCADTAAPAARALFADVVGLRREDHPSAAQLCDRVVRELKGRDVLLLDTFPCGILSELASFAPDVPRVLITRMQRSPLSALESEAGWRGLGLAGVVDIEPPLNWLVGPALRCGPVARRLTPSRLTPGPDVQVALSPSGAGRRVAALLDRIPGVSYEVVDAAGLAIGYSARIVVGAAGYNLSYELRQAGIWHVALPAKRPIDDQFRRAMHLGTLVQSPQALERRLRVLLDSGAPPAGDVLEHGAFARRLVDYVAERTSAKPAQPAR